VAPVDGGHVEYAVHGTGDPMMGSATLPFHKEAGERIREWWPDSEQYVVAGATHALQVVEPAGGAQGLAQFIARH
jgi:pimeloyl-ACP methyl ester carboxylesterase